MRERVEFARVRAPGIRAANRSELRAIARRKPCAIAVLAFASLFGMRGLEAQSLHKLTASDGVTGDMLGSAVAITGATIALGAPNHPANPPSNADYYAGAVYLYERSTLGTWQQSTKLVAPSGDNNAFDAFGSAITIDRSLLAIGAPQDDGSSTNSNAGAVYVYLRTGTTWSLETKLTPPSTNSPVGFGRALSLWDDTLAVGADSSSTDGRVYIYRRLGATWTLEDSFTPVGEPLFGWSVSLFQNTLAVGAPGANSGAPKSGKAFVYERGTAGWGLPQLLVNPEPNDFDQFGWSVALYGRSLVVGTPFDTINAISDTGAAYAFTKVEGQFVCPQVLTSTPALVGQHFGNALAIGNGHLVCGAELAYVEQGRAYQFVAPQASLWGQVAELDDGVGTGHPWFGCAVAISDYIVVGARLDDQVALDAGAGYIFGLD